MRSVTLSISKAGRTACTTFLSLFILIFLSQPAFAQGVTDAFQLDIALGIKGGLNGSWSTEVPEDLQISGVEPDSNYYGSFGLGYDAGVAFEIKVLGFIGVETGARISFDNGEGFNEQKLNGEYETKFYQKQSTRSWHIPLFVKLSTSSGLVRPTIGLGGEFVLQDQSTLEYSKEPGGDPLFEAKFDTIKGRNGIETSDYFALGATLGLEIDLGAIHIPIELRGLYNIGYGKEAKDRVRVDDNGNYIYDGAYQGHFGLSIGILYNYELLL